MRMTHERLNRKKYFPPIGVVRLFSAFAAICGGYKWYLHAKLQLRFVLWSVCQMGPSHLCCCIMLLVLLHCSLVTVIHSHGMKNRKRDEVEMTSLSVTWNYTPSRQAYTTAVHQGMRHNRWQMQKKSCKSPSVWYQIQYQNIAVLVNMFGVWQESYDSSK